NVTYKDKAETFTGGFPVYEGNKPVLTLKELDFRIRQTLIKSKKLYNNSYNKGQIKIPINVMMKPIIIMKSISVAIRKTPIKVITTKTIDQI
ncbi:exotoxin beta-grasp domain-containing protein, partial [Staphylococcus aureus]|uniref:exotoxin beta-grasp domain-containing protein n=1 Tax=Staphylococcus aureus TaxID=1280 RepID=UPI003D76A1E1